MMGSGIGWYLCLLSLPNFEVTWAPASAGVTLIESEVSTN